MDKRAKVLIYDDEEEVVDNIISETRKTLGPSDSREFVHFRRGFNWDRGKYREDLHPAELPSGYEPDVFVVTAANITRKKGKHVWWQAEFAGAILDIYDEGGEPLGNKFADWLNLAEFDGPIVVISKGPQRGDHFGRLRSYETVSKTKENWPAKVVEFLGQRSATNSDEPARQLSRSRADEVPERVLPSPRQYARCSGQGSCTRGTLLLLRWRR